jgi:hypothetical protein
VVQPHPVLIGHLRETRTTQIQTDI